MTAAPGQASIDCGVLATYQDAGASVAYQDAALAVQHADAAVQLNAQDAAAQVIYEWAGCTAQSQLVDAQIAYVRAGFTVTLMKLPDFVPVNDHIAIIDGFIFELVRGITDTVGATDRTSMQAIKTESDFATLSDTLNAFTATKSAAEAFSLSDQKTLSISKETADSLTTTDAAKFTVTTTQADVLALTDASAFSLTSRQQDSFTSTDQTQLTITRKYTSGINAGVLNSAPVNR